MEETLEGGRGPPRAVAPLEKERKFTLEQAAKAQRRRRGIALLFI
jgi:hypothetical protein